MLNNGYNKTDGNKKTDHLPIILRDDIIEPEQLHQSELIQELQAFLFEISYENIQTTLQYIIDSVFISNTERLEQLARNIFFAARFRCMKIELLSDLVHGLVSNDSKKQFLGKLPKILMNHFFTKAFHDEYSYKETWRFFFLYQLLKRKIYFEDDIINEIRKFYSKYTINKNEDQVGLFKIMCAWFAPEIEQKAPDLFIFFSAPDSYPEEEQGERNEQNNNNENDTDTNSNIINNNKQINKNGNNTILYDKNIYTENDNDNKSEEDENMISNSNESNIFNYDINKKYDLAYDNDENKFANDNNVEDESKNFNENHVKNENNEVFEEEEEIGENDTFLANANNDQSDDNLQYNETESESETPLIIFQGNGENETRVFDVLHAQGYTLEVLQANNWSFYRQCRESGYTIDPLVKCLLSDDDDELQRLSSEPEFDIETMIEPSLFSRSTILQDSTSPICFAAAVGAVKCFRFLLLNDANLEYETWNEHSTTIASFAVSGGSNEIVRLLNQKGKTFNEALFVAVQYHRTDIFNWLFQLLNADIEIKNIRYGTLLHRAAKSNNIELSLFCMEHRCDVNKPVVNNFFCYFFLYDFFTDDRTPPLSEAIQFQAIDVAKLLLSHKDSTLVPQIEKQDSLVFELIYAHNHEIMPLFIGHKTFESALLRVFFIIYFLNEVSNLFLFSYKPHFQTLLKRCKEFKLTQLIDYFHQIGIEINQES